MKNCILFIAILLAKFLSAQAPIIGFQNIITGLSQPVQITNAADGTNRLFIVEKTGAVKIYSAGVLLVTPFCNISPKISSDGERGLLSIAFHPNYSTNRFFYLYYTNTVGSIVVERYQTKANNANEADTSTGAILFTITKTFANHNGGTIAFGNDGMLYISTGDGGSGGDPENNAQNPNSLLGKMLRVNATTNSTAPYYTIPANNPFVGVNGFREEIVALGLRNPFRWSFDKQTGDMWIGDVGQGAWEEINFRAANNLTTATNYGWRCYEGSSVYTTCNPQTPANNIFPVFEYDHTVANGGFSVTGGHVYRGTEYSFLQGYYLCADYVTNNGWLIKSNGSGGFTTVKQTGWLANIAGFGEAENGTLYAVSLGGTIAKVTAAESLPIQLLHFTATNSGSKHIVKWQVQDEEIGDVYFVERSINNEPFTSIDTIQVTQNATTNSYTTTYIAFANTIRYRLKIVSKTGIVSYSAVVQLQLNEIAEIKVYKIANNIMAIQAKEIIQQIHLFDANGKQIAQKKGNSFFESIAVPVVYNGYLVVRVTYANGHSFTTKIL
jgi:glucose/arabinose dehydrogenase